MDTHFLGITPFSCKSIIAHTLTNGTNSTHRSTQKSRSERIYQTVRKSTVEEPGPPTLPRPV